MSHFVVPKVVQNGLNLRKPNLALACVLFIILLFYFYVSSCSLFYGCKRLLGGILRPIPKFFSKFSLFDHFWPLFWSKIDPKLTFSLNLGAFFSGRVQNGFETQNGFTRSGFRGIPSLVPKFAFLVVEIGLRKPPNLRIFFYYFIIRLGFLT